MQKKYSKDGEIVSEIIEIELNEAWQEKLRGAAELNEFLYADKIIGKIKDKLREYFRIT